MIYNFFLPKTNLFMGRGSLEYIGEEAKKLGDNALLVTGKSSMENTFETGKGPLRANPVELSGKDITKVFELSM